MAHPRSFIAPLSRLGMTAIALPKLGIPRLSLLPFQSARCLTTKSHKKKRLRSTFIRYDLNPADQFSLIDAMQYIRAFEVGRHPSSAKYEVHIQLRALKNGPAVRNRLRLPHPVKTDTRICVIAPPDSKAAEEARLAGATMVGEEDIFKIIKTGIIDFDRCICHTDSLQKLNKAGLGRYLGSKGLMPSVKAGTVVHNVGRVVKDMVSGSEYKERIGVIRMAIGQLGFTPEEMFSNIKAFMGSVEKDIAKLAERTNKKIHEVVLSSTNSPGFSLNGEYKGPNSIPAEDLSGPP